jgi:hypothetical protein
MDQWITATELADRVTVRAAKAWSTWSMGEWCRSRAGGVPPVAADGVAAAGVLDEHVGGQDRQGGQAGGDLPDVQVLGLDNGRLGDEFAPSHDTQSRLGASRSRNI